MPRYWPKLWSESYPTVHLLEAHELGWRSQYPQIGRYSCLRSVAAAVASPYLPRRR